MNDAYAESQSSEQKALAAPSPARDQAMDFVSPYIAESLRRQRLEAEQRRALANVVDELIPEHARHRLLGTNTLDGRIATLRKRRTAKAKAYRKDATRNDGGVGEAGSAASHTTAATSPKRDLALSDLPRYNRKRRSASQ